VQVPILLVVGDDLSTDEILPAGARVLPYRSNIPKISEFAFEGVDSTYPKRAASEKTGHAILAGRNYGQGSSREHAALATRYLGLRLVLAQSFARIHWENLINFGVLPVTFESPADASSISRGDVLSIDRVANQLAPGELVTVGVGDRSIRVRHSLSERQRAILQAGGLINWMRERRTS
jgi:aconitate hydratase